MPGISSECDKGCSKRSCKAFCRLHHPKPITSATRYLMEPSPSYPTLKRTYSSELRSPAVALINPVLAFRRFEHSSGLRLFLELVHTYSASLPLPILFQQHPEHAVFSVKAVSLAVVTFYCGVVGENGDISKESSVNLVRLEDFQGRVIRTFQ